MEAQRERQVPGGGRPGGEQAAGAAGVGLGGDQQRGEPAPDVLGRGQNEAKRGGLIIGRGGLHANVIRICPPLIVLMPDGSTAMHRWMTHPCIVMLVANPCRQTPGASPLDE